MLGIHFVMVTHGSDHSSAMDCSLDISPPTTLWRHSTVDGRIILVPVGPLLNASEITRKGIRFLETQFLPLLVMRDTDNGTGEKSQNAACAS